MIDIGVRNRTKGKTKQKDTIYLVPHSHFDAIWIFAQDDYFSINMDILREVAELVDCTDYKFLLEQTFLLEEMEKRYPGVFVKMAARIKEGRIEIADEEYLMADTMLPDGETLNTNKRNPDG